MIQTLISLKIVATIQNEGESTQRESEVVVEHGSADEVVLVRTYGDLLLERALPEFVRDNGPHPDQCLCDVCVCHKTGEHHSRLEAEEGWSGVCGLW